MWFRAVKKVEVTGEICEENRRRRGSSVGRKLAARARRDTTSIVSVNGFLLLLIEAM